MTLFQVILTYIVTWCIAMFLLLPVRHERFGVGKKILANTLLSAVIVLLLHLAITYEWMEIRDSWQWETASLTTE